MGGTSTGSTSGFPEAIRRVMTRGRAVLVTAKLPENGSSFADFRLPQNLGKALRSADRSSDRLVAASGAGREPDSSGAGGDEPTTLPPGGSTSLRRNAKKIHESFLVSHEDFMYKVVLLFMLCGRETWEGRDIASGRMVWNARVG